MKTENTVRCFDCDGEGYQPFSGFIDRAGPRGTLVGEVVMNGKMPCPRCKEKGEIPAEMLEWKRLGGRIKKARLKLKKTQREMAKHLGMRPSDYAYMENGYRDPMELLEFFPEVREGGE